MTRNVRVLARADDVRVSQGVVTGLAPPTHWTLVLASGPRCSDAPTQATSTNQSTGLHTHNQATSYPKTNGIKSEMIVSR